jgi:Reverse transcriptase (RNA-dependent DNA polymerase)
LFAKKPRGGLRFCIDYYALNAITIKNYYPLPLIQEILARLSRAKIYTKLDVIIVFNYIYITEGQEYLTAFNIYYGLYETLIILFGLSNIPATFQTYINKVLYPYLDVFCTAYIDDILVYSDDLTSYKQHVRLVVEVLQDTSLQLDIKKYEFEVTEVTYLGIIVSTDSMRMDPAKIIAITN